MNNLSCSCGDIKHETETLCKPKKDTALSSLSPKDSKWDEHRYQADVVSYIYRYEEEFKRLSDRMNDCSGVLKFRQEVNDDGEFKLKLKRAQFCRVRHCPVCQWRRSLMWQARFYQSLPMLLEKQEKSRWLFLTLTVRNCEIDDLRSNIQNMGKSWQRLIKRKEFTAVKGWLRTTEVTRGKDGSAHPHFHVLLMVQPSYFTKYYIKKSRWIELWQSCLKANYKPNIDVRTVKKLKNDDDKTALDRAVAETLKYAVKPSDMTEDGDWFRELTRQVHQLRFIASGGLLKDILKEDKEENDDLLLQTEEENEEDDDVTLDFSWRGDDRKYRRKNY